LDLPAEPNVVLHGWPSSAAISSASEV
jgi:hypothetical protein